MLAEHNRTGPALAANPATFPLNDVVYLLSRAIRLDQRRQQNPVFFRIGQNQLEAIRPSTRKGRGMVEPVGIEPTT